jgi:hypothetical protein
MPVYWMMFAIPALALLSPYRAEPNLARGLWLAVATIFAVLIGLRYEIGADWLPYVELYERAIGISFWGALETSDPGYAVLNWLSARVSGDVYLVNLACGALLMSGVIAFARRQPLPWLALLVAVPYMIIVVGMGYTRQSAAMGFVLLGLVALANGRLLRFAALIACGALFHKSAVLLLPLAALASTRHQLWTWVWVTLTTVMMAGLILIEYQEALWQEYVEAGMVSEGGGIRVAMNALPSLLFLLFRKRLGLNEHERRLWSWIALFSLASVPLVGLASTAVDRVALYFMPIQMLVFSRLHRLVDTRLYRTQIALGVVIGYALVQWVWLTFASHAPYWVPYRFAPFM